MEETLALGQKQQYKSDDDSNQSKEEAQRASERANKTQDKQKSRERTGTEPTAWNDGGGQDRSGEGGVRGARERECVCEREAKSRTAGIDWDFTLALLASV